MEVIKRGRGRLPGELKGSKYNVPPKKQITVNLTDEHCDMLDKLSQELKVSRSKMLNTILEQFIQSRGYK